MASLKDVRDILGDALIPTQPGSSQQREDEQLQQQQQQHPTPNVPLDFQLTIPQSRRLGKNRSGTLDADAKDGTQDVPVDAPIFAIAGSSAQQRQAGPSSTTTNPSETHPPRSAQPPPKRLNNSRSSYNTAPSAPTISRELYALIGDSAPSLRLVQEELGIGRDGKGLAGDGARAGGDRAWGKGKGRAKNVKWVLQEFTPPHHPSLPSTLTPLLPRPTSLPSRGPLILRHYRPSSSSTGGIVLGSSASAQDEWSKNLAAFGKDGEGRGVMEYTGWEYEKWLGDPSWTPLETAYLFSLLRAYDLRFLIVADRYAYLPPGGADPTSSAQADGQPAWPPASVINKQKERAEGIRKSTRGRIAGEPEPEQGTEAQPAAQPILATAATIAQARERRATRSIANLKDVDTTAANGERSAAASPARGSRHGTPAETLKAQERERADKARAAEKAAVKSDVKIRTLEEIKHRYYSICRKLIEKRPAADEALRQRHMKMYDFDFDREVARKKAANALFHLNKSEIQEQEALYVELKKMEQNERRYKAEREELMRRMAGIESGIFRPGKAGEGNAAFGDGKVAGIGMARGADGVVVAQVMTKKRKRGDDGEPVVPPEPEPVPVVKKRQDPLADERNNIYRLPMARDLPARALHQPAHLRSTKLPVPKAGATFQKVIDLMTEMGVNPVRLIMPTRTNVDKLDGLMSATQDLVEMKRQFDRIDQEVKALRALAGGGNVAVGAVATPMMPHPVAAAAHTRDQRSSSVLSSAMSDSAQRTRK